MKCTIHLQYTSKEDIRKTKQTTHCNNVRHRSDQTDAQGHEHMQQQKIRLTQSQGAAEALPERGVVGGVDHKGEQLCGSEGLDSVKEIKRQ